jgi:hypothetical protein
MTLRGITSSARLAEERRKTEAEVKPVIRKNKESRTQAINTDHVCTICGRAYHARIGLVGHFHPHKNVKHV